MSRRTISLSCMLLLGAISAGAGSRPRAWQERLQLEIPLPVPRVELAASNPFVAEIDGVPTFKSATPPEKIDVSGYARLAVYITNQGECRGAVPLELPFPGITSAILTAARDGKYEAAHSGDIPRSSWLVLDLGVKTRVKEGKILHQELALPDPHTPPEAIKAAIPPPSGQLLKMKAAPHEELSSLARPKRLRLRAPSGERTVSFQALVHITPEGRCDRYVPLLANTGLDRWFSAFLATWRLTRPMSGDQAHDAWLVYTARIRLKFSSFSSSSFRLSGDQDYIPQS